MIKNAIGRVGLLLFCSVFISCELTKEIDYQGGNFEPRLVVVGYISAEHGVDVLVTKTVPPDRSDQDVRINQSKVWLIENGQPVHLLVQTDSMKYKLGPDVELKKDAVYQVSVSADNLPDVVSGPQSFVSKAKIDTAYFYVDTTYNQLYNFRYIYVEFDDEQEVDNYYAIDYIYYNNGKQNDPVYSYLLPLWTFDDSEFMNKRYVGYDRISEQEFDSLEVVLYSFSKVYSDYLNSLDNQLLSYEDLYSEGIYPVLSNIENGFGIFSSYEADRKIIKKIIK